MQMVTHHSAEAFLEHAEAYLLQKEVEHNLLLGVPARLVGRESLHEDTYLAHVEDATGQVIGVVMRVPPGGIVLSALVTQDCLPLIFEAVTQRFESIPSVMGAKPEVDWFFEQWCTLRNVTGRLDMSQGIYQLDEVLMPQVKGEYHPATFAERELSIDWALAFEAEALEAATSREDMAKAIDAKLNSTGVLNCLRMWWDEGQPVSMLSAHRATPNGMGLALVYTPPELRGRGYASAATAHLSQEILDSGRKFCFLYTDLSNPTSNKIYQAVGYRFVTYHYVYKFA